MDFNLQLDTTKLEELIAHDGNFSFAQLASAWLQLRTIADIILDEQGQVREGRIDRVTDNALRMGQELRRLRDIRAQIEAALPVEQVANQVWAALIQALVHPAYPTHPTTHPIVPTHVEARLKEVLERYAPRALDPLDRMFCVVKTAGVKFDEVVEAIRALAATHQITLQFVRHVAQLTADDIAVLAETNGWGMLSFYEGLQKLPGVTEVIEYTLVSYK